MLKPYNRAEVSFDVLQEIGHEGKNSNVFIANDKQLDAKLVMKRVAKRGFSSQDQFFSESKILHFSSHPNVVPVHYACEDSEYVWIAMPHFEKGSLNALMSTRHLTVREIIRYSTQFLSGLHNIHSKGLIHFDIKPDNILLSSRDEAMLSDFGLAKHMTFAGHAEQDKLYFKQIPPEYFAAGDQYDKTFDIFQTGLTLYRMCNGNTSFYDQFDTYIDQGQFDKNRFKFDVRNGRFPDRLRFLHHIPDKMRKTIRKCLEVDPSNRFQSALEVVNAMAAIEGCDLDWQYEEKNAVKKWRKFLDEKEYILEVDAANSGTATKKMNGTERRITEYCLEGITPQKIRNFLKAF